MESIHMLMQVHDELIFEIKDTEVEKEVKKLKEIMEGVLEGKETHNVPIVADVSTGPNWAELQDVENIK